MSTLYTILAKDVRTLVNSIRINAQLVGMQDVWGNVSSPVTPHAPPLVLEVVPTMMRKTEMEAINPGTDKDVEPDVRSTASADVLVCVLGTAYRPAGTPAKIHVLTTVAGSVSPSAAADVNLGARRAVKMSAQDKLMRQVVWVAVRHPVSTVVIRIVLE